MLNLEQGTEPLGFEKRLKIWLKSLNVRNMISTMKDYVKELFNTLLSKIHHHPNLMIHNSFKKNIG